MTRGRTANAAVTTVAAGTPEEVVAVAVAIPGVEVVGQEVEAAGREAEEAGREVEEAWAAGEDKLVLGEVPWVARIGIG
jgi:hypothetical protein